MRWLVTNKVFVSGLLALLILIPLGRVEGLVQERKNRRAEVEADIARSASGSQMVAGPVMVLPCTESYTEIVESTAPGNARNVVNRTRDCTQFVLPTRLVIGGDVATDTRKRGIYETLVYSAALTLDGMFELPPPEPLHAGTLNLGEAYLTVGVADPRGLAGAPAGTVRGREIVFEPGSALRAIGPGIHAPLGNRQDPLPRTFPFSLAFRLNGMQQLGFIPLGRATEARIASPWPHPSFVGAYLPVDRAITDAGFDARWATSFLATNIEENFSRALDDSEQIGQLQANSFGINFIPAVDMYLKSERATKYGFLFVGITFIALLLTEVLRKLQIHPLQYLMVGVALAMFFLLVLALSEHIGFGLAYSTASVACVALIGFYLSSCLSNRRLATGFAAALGGLYGLLYGLLSSEDHALLLGSLLVFGILAATMLVTRRVDWYATAAGPK